MTRVAAALAFLALAATPALAEKACFLAYSGFEEKVPHLDIEVCPGHQVTPEQGFCRIALQGHEVLVYLFRHGDGPEPCLAQVDRYTFNEFAARFGTVYDKP
jgi:hypothetical protein